MLVEKVLITTDFSKHSAQLINCIPELKAIGLKEIVLVHVIDIRSPGGAAIAFKNYDEQMLNQVKAEMEKSGLQVIRAERNQKLMEIKKELEALGLKMDSIIEVGNAPEHIVEIADNEAVTSIIISTRGAGFIKGLLVGSTADAVTRKSTRPVVLIPCRN